MGKNGTLQSDRGIVKKPKKTVKFNLENVAPKSAGQRSSAVSQVQEDEESKLGETEQSWRQLIPVENPGENT